MRDLVLIATLLSLLPLVVARPFAGVLLWCWISFMNPHREVWGVAAQMPWALMIFCATALGCVARGEPRRFVPNAVTALVLVLMACFTVTSAAAMWPDTAWGKWSSVSKVLLGLLLTAALLTERRRVHALIWVMVISLGYYGVKGGVFAIVTGGSFRVWGPPQTMIEDNNHLAAALLVSLPLMNYLRLQSRHWIVRVGLVAAMALTLLAIVSSYSRGALLGLVATAVLMWLRSKQKLVSGVALAACLAGAVSFMPDQWVQRMNTLETYQEDGSASDRLAVWAIAYKFALHRPLLGSGFNGLHVQEVVNQVEPGGRARATHSIWFELLGEHGFPTFAIWVGLTVAGLFYAVRLARIARDRPDLAWAGDLGRMAPVSIVAYLVSGTFLSLSYWDYYWTLLVALGATHTLALQARRQEGAPARALPSAWRLGASARPVRPGAVRGGAVPSPAPLRSPCP